MMSVTVNAFPPFQSMNSPRGWVLATIVLLHAVFFWILTSSMGVGIFSEPKPPIKVVDVPIPKPTAVKDTRNYNPDLVEPTPVFVPRPDIRFDDNPPQGDLSIVSTTEVPPPAGGAAERIPTPVTVSPAIDPRMPLTEPEYPATEIRMGHTGTVMLSIFVLENGRVGDVRIEQSSGFERLDNAAAREAKRWKFQPGTQDGRLVGMWKQIPITFQLRK